MRGRAVAVAIMTAIIVCMTAGVALAAGTTPWNGDPIDSAAECRWCHEDPGEVPASYVVSVSAGPVLTVNRGTACVKCHKSYLVNSHPQHNWYTNCGSCHPQWNGWNGSTASRPLYTAFPAVNTTAGAFNVASSKDATSGALHVIHYAARWPAGADASNSRCKNCHAVPDCAVCHENPAADSHGLHADGRLGSDPSLNYTGTITNGLPGSMSETSTAFTETSLYCGSDGCHAIRGQASVDATVAESFPYVGPTWTTSQSGTWWKNTKPFYTAGHEAVTNVFGSKYTVVFTGEQVEFISDRDPYRGKARMTLTNGAGTIVETLTAYAATTQYQYKIYTSPKLQSGVHTLTIEPLGDTDSAGGRADFFAVDALYIYPKAPGWDTFSPFNTTYNKPNCATSQCHTPSSTYTQGSHGGVPVWNHVETATLDSTQPPATVAGLQCKACHMGAANSGTDMRSEHARNSSSKNYWGSPSDSCEPCHNRGQGLAHEYVASITANPTFNYTCTWGACHNNTYANVPHSNQTTMHTASAGSQASCLQGTGCHGSDANIANIHVGYGKACTICHGNTEAAYKTWATKDCTNCHSTYHASFTASHTATGDIALTAYGGSNDATGNPCTYCHKALLGTKSAPPSDTLSAGEHDWLWSKGATSMADGVVTCRECHNAAFGGRVSRPWSKNCYGCHKDYGTLNNKTHGAAAHDFSADASSAACWTGCHNSWFTSIATTGLNDVAALHRGANAAGGSWYTTWTVPAAGCKVCHRDGPTQPATGQAGYVKGSWSGVPHATKCNDCHHTSGGTDYTHDVTQNSTYTASSYSESGCTNSNGGCHGSVTNIGTIHTGTPYSSCSLPTACHNSTAKGLGIQTCLGCHDGHSGDANPTPDRVELYGAYPNGHYSESTHTAASASTVTSVTVTGWSATARCNQCHNPTNGSGIDGLYYQHQALPGTAFYGTNVACQECHNDSNVNGQNQVLAKWSTDNCSDCHTATSTAPAHSASIVQGNDTLATNGAYSCASAGTNCHANYLHLEHTKASGCTVTGCHNYAQQANKPAKVCETCHTSPTYVLETHGTVTGNDTSHTAGAAQDTATYNTAYGNVQCGVCHGMALSREHTATFSSMPGSGTQCQRCHNRGSSTNAISTYWSSRSTASACQQCHDGTAEGGDPTAIPVAHGGTFNLDTSHTVSAGTCAGTGAGCHVNNLANVGSYSPSGPIHSACIRCHDKNGTASYTSGSNTAYNPSFKGCGSASNCHNAVNYYTFNSGTQAGNHANVAQGNNTTHTATFANEAGFEASATAFGCANCHSAGMKAAHTTTTAGVVGCTTGGTGDLGCHNNRNTTNYNDPALVVKNSWSAQKKCTDCHKQASSHTGIDTSHTASADSTTTGCYNSGAGCHLNQSNLRLLHGTKCGAAGCHAVDKIVTAKSCGAGNACHSTYTNSNHNGTTALESTHTASGDATSQPGSKAYASYTGYTDTTGTACGNCHDARLGATESLMGEHYVVRTAGASGTSISCAECHTAYSTVVKGNWLVGGKTKQCSACHGGVADSYLATATHGDATRHNWSGDTSSNAGCVNNATGCHDADGPGFNFATYGTINDITTYHRFVTTATAGVGSCRAACHVAGADTTVTTVPNVQAADSTTTVLATKCQNCHHAGGASWNHLATTLSDYSETTVTAGRGCTNSGAGCHDAVYNVGTIHTGTAYSSCSYTTSCHNKGGGTPYNSKVSGNHECEQCHAGAYADTPDRVQIYDAYPAGHYSATTHTAGDSSFTTYTVNYNCSSCHLLPLYTEHQRSNISTLQKCKTCHDARSSVVDANWPGRACTAASGGCHLPIGAVGTSTHPTATVTAGHNGALAANSGCQVAGCHPTTDLAALHSAATTNVAGYGSVSGCNVCHRTNYYPPTGNPGKTCSTCHDAAELNATHHLVHQLPTTQTADTFFANSDCTGPCHSNYIDYAHGVDTNNPSSWTFNNTASITPGTFTCATCHSATPGSAVATAITGGIRQCWSCHRGTTGYTAGRYHRGDVLSEGGTYPKLKGENLYTKYTADYSGTTSSYPSVHRGDGITASALGTYYVNAVATPYKFSRVSSAAFGTTTQMVWTYPTTTFVSGWTVSTPTPCNSCHGAVAAARQTTVSVDMTAPATYTQSYYTAVIGGTPDANADGYQDTLVCAACHTTFGNNAVHSTGGHGGYRCIACHVAVPHAATKPRLMRFNNTAANGADEALPAPDATYGGIIAFQTLTTPWTAASWANGDCATNPKSGFTGCTKAH